MRLIRTLCRAERAEIDSDCEFLSRVTRLVDCLERPRPGAGGTLRDAAEEALTAAIDAERRLAEQSKRIEVLERLARTDEVTGLLNRRGFHAELRRAVAAAGRYDERGVLIYVALDGFKPINDAYGQTAGDEVLRRVAGTLRDCVRTTDTVGRMGGDEFCILFPRTSWKDGLARAEELDRIVNHIYVGWRDRMIAVRASLGLHAYGIRDDSGDLLDRGVGAMDVKITCPPNPGRLEH
jgi:diguanylate cyclase (GGDEF)-like protein